MNAGQKLGTAFALVAAAALTTVALPENAQAQTPVYAQPGAVPGPTTAPYALNDNYQETAIPQGYYGPAMTQQGVNEVAAQPIGNPLYYSRKGFTQATLADGEHIGIEYNLDANGYAYIMDPNTSVYDLNNPSELQRWNQNVNAWERDNANRQASYNTAVAAGTYYGPAVYTGGFTPCWHRHGGFEVAVAVGGLGVEVFDPYDYEIGYPVIIEPVFYGRGWAYEQMMYERELFYGRMGYPYYGGTGVNIFINIGGHRGIWDERLPGHFHPWERGVYGRGFERGREFERGRVFEPGRNVPRVGSGREIPRVDPRREVPRVDPRREVPRVDPRRDFPGRRETPYIHQGAGAQQAPVVRQMPQREAPRTFEPRQGGGGQQGPFIHQGGGGQQHAAGGRGPHHG